MAGGAYYNEFSSDAASWLRELIKSGQIAAGDVDERSIEDVHPEDLRGYTQCHFFAGIGGWSLALRRAGWDDTRPVWTGSCPCQPFSSAGAGKGFADERHLWPDFFHLIEQCRPPVVFGEQVAGPDGLVWLDLVQADLEAAGYAVGAADLCAAGVGAPHIRQRLYWVADSTGTGQRAQPGQRGAELDARSAGDARSPSRAGWMGDADRNRAWRDAGAGPRSKEGASLRAVSDLPFASCAVGGMADASSPGWRSGRTDGDTTNGSEAVHRARKAEPGRRDAAHGSGPLDGHWRDADWLGCRDGKWRPVEPGTFPLAHGLPARVGRLRGYGNAIVPQVAEAFIRASGVIA